MSLPALRQLSAVKNLADMKQLVVDIQANFNLLANAPRLIQSKPAAGTLKFLAIDENGDWTEWSLVAGAGMTLTPNFVTKTLTLTSP